MTQPEQSYSREQCIEDGGHFWPDPRCEGNEPHTCARCGYNPGWVHDPNGDQQAEQSDSRTVVDVDVTHHFEVDVTDWLDTPSYRTPDAHELKDAAEGIMEYHHGEQGDGRTCVGYTIKARV